MTPRPALAVFWFLASRSGRNSVRRGLRNPLRLVLLVLGLVLYVLLAADAVSRPAQAVPYDAEHPIEETLAILTLAALGATLAVAATRASAPAFGAPDADFVFPAPLDRVAIFRVFLVARSMASALVATAVLVPLVLFEVASRRGPSPTTGAGGLLLLPALVLLAQLGVTLLATLHAARKRRTGDDRIALVTIVCGAGLFTTLLLSAGVAWWDGHAWTAGIVAVLNTAPLTWALAPFRAIAEAALVQTLGASAITVAGSLWWLALAARAWRALGVERAILYDLAAAGAALAAETRESPVVAREHALRRLARKGALRAACEPVLASWRPEGVAALVWQQVIAFWRVSHTLVFGAAGIALVAVAGSLVARLLGAGMSVAVPGREATAWTAAQDPTTWLDVLLLIYGLLGGVLALFLFIHLAVAAQEAVHRVEILKPLPFPLPVLLAAEASAGVLVAGALGAVWAIGALVVWPGSAASTLFAAPLALTFLFPAALGGMLQSLVVPDSRDLFQGLVAGVLAPVALFGPLLPGALALAVAVEPGAPRFVGGLAVLLANGFVSVSLLALCARRYAAFTPQE